MHFIQMIKFIQLKVLITVLCSSNDEQSIEK